MLSLTPLWERFSPHRGIGCRVYGFHVVTTTMDLAWQYVAEQAPHGTAVLAEGQTQGRGRFGRPWVSRPGQSLALSVIVRPHAGVTPRLSIIASLAVRDAVRELAGLDASIKWPNDVRVGGRKVSGILAEGRATTDGDVVVVIGIGLNLGLDTTADPDLQASATSLEAESGRSVSAIAAADAVLRWLDSWYQRLLEGDDVVSEWRRALDTLGRRVTVRQRERELSGVAEDVTEDGLLLLRTDDGALHTLAEGDVTLHS